MINLDFNAAAAAAKQIDATWGGSTLTALQAKGLAEIPLTTKDLGDAGSIQAVLVGSAKLSMNTQTPWPRCSRLSSKRCSG